MAHMEATILDTNFNIVGIVDDYQSMIWTERYSEAGDFELYGATNSTIAAYCKMGYFVTIPESDRAMIIESIEVSEETDKSNKILVKGRSLESILMRRIVWDQTILTGSVQNAIYKLIYDSILNPTDSNRVIPNFYFLQSTDTAITSLSFESAQFTGDTIFDAIKQFADAFEIGFKIELIDGKMIFSLFAGKDRSYAQNVNPYVVFSDDYDNIVSSDFKNNMSNYQNVALVAGEGEGSERRKIEYYTSNTAPSGINRYETFVDARDISSNNGEITDEEYMAELQNRGDAKLAEVEEDWSFDCQIDTQHSYQYGKDYFIGDILQLIGILGIQAQARITEFIRCTDTNGYSAYPQFKIIDVIED